MRDRIKISLGAVWEEAIAFVRAEWSLLLPVAMLGFGVPTILVLLAVPMDAAQTGMVKPGPWMLWFLPAGLISMLGSLAVSALTLTPGMSVREGIVLAFRRLPVGLGLFVLYVGVQVLLALPLLIASAVEARLGGGPGPVSMVINLANIAVTIWLFVRVMPLWAVLADRPGTPWGVARAAFTLTRGCYPKLLLLRVVMTIASVMLMVVLLIPIGALTQLLGMALGGASVAIILSFVATGALLSMIGGVWTVYVACLYRRLEAGAGASISGR